MEMFTDEILQDFLDKAVENAKEEIKRDGRLSIDNAMPLLLKSQFNHILHLDRELSDIRKNMVTRDEFNRLNTHFNRGLAFLGLLIAIVGILMPVLLK